MNRLGFLIARTLRDEAALQSLSAPQSELLGDLAGKRVALIGNARALAQAHHGTTIDAADLVIRINRAPMPAATSHGTRTDWLGLAVRLGDADRARIAPGRVLWMSPKRKRLDWQTAHSPGFYLHPLPAVRELEQALGAPPSTGIMTAALVLAAPVAALTLYGFDFFASLSLSGSRGKADVPHDFAAEAAWFAARAEADVRLRIT